MTERRIYTRTPIEMAASYGIPDDLPITEEATVVNISSDGFGFFSLNPISPETELILCVDLDDGEKATLLVRTKWAKAVGDTGRFIIGVQIIEAESADLERFLEFYAKLTKQHLRKVA